MKKIKYRQYSAYKLYYSFNCTQPNIMLHFTL